MITQVIWTDVNNRELDNIYARSGDEEIREIQFIICRNNPPEKVEIPAGVSGQFRMIKSSGNFVVRDMTKTVKEDGTVIFTVSVSDQMVNVQGTGYYDIRLSGGGYLYTASGRFIVDMPVISSAVLEDVSEVNGLVFPDDFLTTDDNVPRIDDSVTSSSSVWSSFKTNSEIADQIEEAIGQIPIPEVSDDYVLNEEKKVGTWLGKDLYRNVVVSQGAWSGGTKTLWSLSGAHLVKWDVLIQNPYWSGTWIIPNGDNGRSLKFWAYGDSSTGDALICDNLGGYTVSKIYAIVYYTKESW